MCEALQKYLSAAGARTYQSESRGGEVEENFFIERKEEEMEGRISDEGQTDGGREDTEGFKKKSKLINGLLLGIKSRTVKLFFMIKVFLSIVFLFSHVITFIGTLLFFLRITSCITSISDFIS